MASINKITVKGFRNIESTTIDLQNITCLLAPNNYGKSNLLYAIDFGYHFMGATADKKLFMMQFVNAIPVNKAVAGKPFLFCIEGALDETRDFQYGYQFDWAQNNLAKDQVVDGKITGEFFKIRDNKKEKPKFSTIFLRMATDGAQLEDATNRCLLGIPSW